MSSPTQERLRVCSQDRQRSVQMLLDVLATRHLTHRVGQEKHENREAMNNPERRQLEFEKEQLSTRIHELRELVKGARGLTTYLKEVIDADRDGLFPGCVKQCSASGVTVSFFGLTLIFRAEVIWPSHEGRLTLWYQPCEPGSAEVEIPVEPLFSFDEECLVKSDGSEERPIEGIRTFLQHALVALQKRPEIRFRPTLPPPPEPQF